MTGRYRAYGLCACFVFMLLPIISGAKGYGVTFSFIAADKSGEQVYNEQGKIWVNGSCYRMEIEDQLLVVCDGKVQWMYRPQTEDIIITWSQVASELDKQVESEAGALSDSESVGETVQSILSVFAGESGANSRVELKKDVAGVVRELVIYLEDKSYYKIELLSITIKPSFPDGFFTLDPADYPNAVVTDMR